MKKALPIILGLGGLLAFLLLTRRAEAAPTLPEELPVVTPPTEVTFPAASDIMAAQSLAELDAFYRLISEQFITRQISSGEYMGLYNAYAERWRQLAGGS